MRIERWGAVVIAQLLGLLLLACGHCLRADAQARSNAPTRRAQPSEAKRAGARGHSTGPPVITEIRPRHWDVGVPNPLVGRNPERITLTVIGKGFRPGASVLWNGRALKTRYRSGERLEASVPFGMITAMRPRKLAASPQGTSVVISIAVRNPAPGRGLSNRTGFPIVFVLVGG